MDKPPVESTEGNGEPEDSGPLDSRKDEGTGNNGGDVKCGEIEVVSDNYERGGPGLASGSAPSHKSGTSEANKDELELAEADKKRWLDAIKKKDCLSLLEILNGKEDDEWRVSMCLKIRGGGGRTALHVAAMQGCFCLAKLLIDLMCRKFPWSREVVVIVDTEYGGFRARSVHLSEDTVEFMNAKDGRSGLTAFEMANDIIGNTSISQYILHVQMFPEDKEKYGGTFEAYEGTKWRTALAEGDCSMLLYLLECNSRFLLQTCDGLSVLDMAIMKDHKKLVETVVSAFGPARDKISWHAESYFPSELTWERIAEHHFGGWHKDVRQRHGFHVGATQDKLAKLGLGRAKRKVALDSVKSGLELAEKLGSSKEMKGLLGINVEEHGECDTRACDEDRVKFLEALSAQGVFEPGVTEPLESKLPESNDLFIVAKIIFEYWKREWNARFLADVDYNFEEKSSLRFSILRFHYAFKHALQCQDFIEHVLLRGVPRWRTYSRTLCSMCDGQGRTAFHTMVDHYSSSYTFETLWARVGFSTSNFFEQYDSRGRSGLVRAITKQFLEKDTMVYDGLSQIYGDNLSSWQVSKTVIDNKSLIYNPVWLFRASLLFEDEHLFYLFAEGYEPSVLETLFDGVDVNGEEFQARTLLMAAATGSQPILVMCLKTCDPMIEDGEGRTALHYAADANMFKFFQLPLSFYCSIDHRIKFEEHWLKKHREKGQSNVNPVAHQDSSTNQQFDVNVGRRACILMLIQAGVDLSQEDKKRNIPDPGTLAEASFQSWWYDSLVKDTMEKKSSFNQAGNALSVVGTLVAATSYVGPLQPPLNYDSDTGYVESSRLLVKVFMVCNTLAFYLAMASVMFAVVPSLPMPQEGVIDELRRARHTVSWSLFLLVTSIGCILVSFAAASAVVIDNERYYGASDFLLAPSIIGWIFCGIAMVSFFIRMMRLVFFRNSVIRRVYKFSFSRFLKKTMKKPMKNAGIAMKNAGSSIREWTCIFGCSAWWWVRGIVMLIPISLFRRGSFREGIESLRGEWGDVYQEIRWRYE